MDLKLILDIVVALAAFGGLVLAISEWRGRKKLEKRLFESSVNIQSRITRSRFTLDLINQAQASAKLIRFTVFLDDEAFQPDDYKNWTSIFTKLGLTSPANLELDVHFFGLPQTIMPQSEFYIVRAEFQESNEVIFEAIKRLNVKITTISPLGVKKSVLRDIAPSKPSDR